MHKLTRIFIGGLITANVICAIFEAGRKFEQQQFEQSLASTFNSMDQQCNAWSAFKKREGIK